MVYIMKVGYWGLLWCAMLGQAHAYDMSRYTPSDLDAILADSPPVKNLTLMTPRKLRVQIYLASNPSACDTDVLKAALTLQGAPRNVLDSIAITQCINVTTANGNTLRMFIQDRVAESLIKETTIGMRLTLYIDDIYQDQYAHGLLINEFDTR